MSSGINDLLDKIIVLEKQIKKKYPKQEGRVKIANAKQKVDYSFPEPETANKMEWSSRYYAELENSL
jgi:hypothetical protein